MYSLIIKKELLNTFRSVRFQVSGFLLFSLILTAIIVGRQGQNKIQKERAHAQSSMHEEWLNQGEKHPHSATHYGQFAFKPKPMLSFLDVGLDNFTGISVYLESHKQNEVLFSVAQDSNGMTRFGEMTVALILQILLPLLIIFLTFDSFVKEREEGILKLFHAQGISMWQLLNAKAWATYFMVLVIFSPVLLLAYHLLGQAEIMETDLTYKFLLLTSCYMIYFLIFVIMSVLISAFAKNSVISLLTLLGLWIFSCIILPKATTNLADKVFPAPSQFEFKKTIKDQVKNGIDGHNPSDVRLASLKQQILKQYGVEKIEELPVNWAGIAMQAGEEFTDKVYDAEFLKVENIFNQQNRFTEWVGFINPFLAIRNLSMALAGTDYYHHVIFAKAAENQRRYMVKTLNKDMEINHKPNIAYNDYNVGPKMWSNIKPFNYPPPSTASILSRQWRSIAALSIWLILLIGSAYFSYSKISIL